MDESPEEAAPAQEVEVVGVDRLRLFPSPPLKVKSVPAPDDSPLNGSMRRSLGNYAIIVSTGDNQTAAWAQRVEHRAEGGRHVLWFQNVSQRIVTADDCVEMGAVGIRE